MLKLHGYFVGLSTLLAFLLSAVSGRPDPLVLIVVSVQLALLYLFCVAVHVGILFYAVVPSPVETHERIRLFVVLTENVLRSYLRFIPVAFMLTICGSYIDPSRHVAYSASVSWLGSLIVTLPNLWFYTRRFQFGALRLAIPYALLTIFSVRALAWNLAHASSVLESSRLMVR